MAVRRRKRTAERPAERKHPNLEMAWRGESVRPARVARRKPAPPPPPPTPEPEPEPAIAAAATPPAGEIGLFCACGGQTEVNDSRPAERSVRRRRRCLACGERFTTYEIRWPGDPRAVRLLERLLALPTGQRQAVAQVIASMVPATEGTEP